MGLRSDMIAIVEQLLITLMCFESVCWLLQLCRINCKAVLCPRNGDIDLISEEVVAVLMDGMKLN
jgi:hypothetical protein